MAAQYILTRCFAVNQLIFDSPPAWVGSTSAAMRKQPANSHQPCSTLAWPWVRENFSDVDCWTSAHATGAGPPNLRDQSAMRLYLLQRLCQIAVKNKTSGASSDCKLLRRNDFFRVFHRRNTAGPAIAPGVEREERG